MRSGRNISKTETITTKSVGKALLGVIGLGIASGVALVAGTDMIMKKLFPESKQNEEVNE